MSRFRPDRLYIGIEPSRLTLVRLTGLWRPAVIAAEAFAILDSAPETLALPLLERELRSPRWRGTRAHVVLSDVLVRYFIAPVPDGARSPRELAETAKLRSEEIFGDDAKAWTTSVDFAPLATHHLGCALRTSWLDGLKRCCGEAGQSLTAVTPFGISEFNRHERRIGHRSGWFAALGLDTVWLAFKSGNGWRSAQVHHRQGERLSQLPAWLAQAQLRAGIDEPPGRPLWLSGQLADFPPSPEIGRTVARRLSTLTWPGQNETWSRGFRLALSPVWPSCA